MVRRMETPAQPSHITIVEATRLFDVSRATLERRIKSGILQRLEDKTISVDKLDSLFSRRQPDVSPDTSSDTSSTPSDVPDASSDVSPEMIHIQELVDTLRTELDASKDREQKAQEDKTQLLKQLDQAQALLLNEQQNIQRLLTAGQPRREGIRDRLQRLWHGTSQE